MATGDIIGYFQAQYEFVPQNEEELALQPGDVIAVTAQDVEWWEGVTPDGRSGLFPATFVAPYTEQNEQEQLGAVPLSTGDVSVEVTTATPIPQAQPVKVGNSPVLVATEVKYQGTEMKSAPKGDVLAVKSSVAAPKSKTFYGLWSSNMAMIAAVFALMLGLVNLIWAGQDEGVAQGNAAIYVTSGLYTMGVGAGTLWYENGRGRSRTGNKIPYRGGAYLLLCIYMFMAVPTVFCAVMYLAVAIANFVATGEQYEQPKQQQTDLSAEEQAKLAKKPWLQQAEEWIVLQRKRSATGVLVFMFLYFMANLLVWSIALGEWVEKNNNFPPNEKLSGWAPLAKAFGNQLDLNCALLVVPVLRSMIRILYNVSTRDRTCFANMLRAVLQFVPLDRALDFHKIIAKVTAAAAIGHTVMHLFNYIVAPDNTINKFGVWPWVSGGIIFMCMLFIYSAAAPEVKHGQFEIFWYNHHFFVGFFFFLLVHGDGGFNPNFWKWFVGPGILYIIERCLREYRARQDVVLLSVTNMRPNVLALEFAKEGIWADPYQDGQYVFIKCPRLSRLEWHPFTISSAPEEETVTVHIRKMAPGSWTAELADYLSSMGRAKATRFELSRMTDKGTVPGKIVGPDDQPLLQIDGPHSAPTQHVTEYHTAMVVGGGIGVTPVAATLKSVILHRWRFGMGQCFPDNAYFYWVCSAKELDSFRWFLYAIKECADELTDQRVKNESSMKQKRFQFHFFITRLAKDTKPKILELPPGEDSFGYWGKRSAFEDAAQRGVKLDKVQAPFSALELYSFLRCPNPKLWRDPQYAHLVPQNGGVTLPESDKYIQMGDDIYIWNGRPKWDDRFREVAERHKRGNIGVCFCGNPYIAADLETMCTRYSNVEQDRYFELHKENF